MVVISYVFSPALFRLGLALEHLRGRSSRGARFVVVGGGDRPPLGQRASTADMSAASLISTCSRENLRRHRPGVVRSGAWSPLASSATDVRGPSRHFFGVPARRR